MNLRDIVRHWHESDISSGPEILHTGHVQTSACTFRRPQRLHKHTHTHQLEKIKSPAPQQRPSPQRPENPRTETPRVLNLPLSLAAAVVLARRRSSSPLPRPHPLSFSRCSCWRPLETTPTLDTRAVPDGRNMLPLASLSGENRREKENSPRNKAEEGGGSACVGHAREIVAAALLPGVLLVRRVLEMMMPPMAKAAFCV